MSPFPYEVREPQKVQADSLRQAITHPAARLDSLEAVGAEQEV